MYSDIGKKQNYKYDLHEFSKINKNIHGNFNYLRNVSKNCTYADTKTTILEKNKIKIS